MKSLPRLVVALCLIGTWGLVGCGGGDDGSKDDFSPEPEPELIDMNTLMAPVAIESRIQGGPPADRLEMLLGLLDEDQVLDSCPLGSADALFAGWPPNWARPTERNEVYSYGANLGVRSHVGECAIEGRSIRWSWERVPDGFTEQQILTGVSLGNNGVSEPVDFFEGRAVTACADEDVNDGDNRCHAAWFNEDLLFVAYAGSPDPIVNRDLMAEWLAAMIPAVLGDEEAAAAATPFNVSGTLLLTDPEGYTLNADYAFTGTRYSEDPTNSPPGVTELVQTMTGQVTLTNTTPGRATDLGTLIFHPAGVYDLDSAVCEFLDDRRGVAFTDRYCMMRMGTSITWLTSEVDTLAPDQVDTRSTSDSPSGGESQTRVAEVREKDAAALIEAYESPAGIVFYGGLPGGEDFNTPPKWEDEVGCSLRVSIGGNGYTWRLFHTPKTPEDLC